MQVILTNQRHPNKGYNGELAIFESNYFLNTIDDKKDSYSTFFLGYYDALKRSDMTKNILS